jgi:hypothetical protein
MKLLNIFVTAFLLAFTTVNAQAIPASAQSLKPDPTLFTIHFKTNEWHVFTGYTERLFAGSSQKDPCSDLSFFHTSDWTGISNWDHKFDSEAIIGHFGKRATCIKQDIIWNDSVYSTGNIQVMWDEETNSYVSATPSEVTLDFDKATPAS